MSSSLTECDSLFDGKSKGKLFARMQNSVKLIPNDINASPITKHRVQSNVIRRLDLFVAFNGLLGRERPRPQVFLLGISNNFFHVYLINKTHNFFFKYIKYNEQINIISKIILMLNNSQEAFFMREERIQVFGT